MAAGHRTTGDARISRATGRGLSTGSLMKPISRLVGTSANANAIYHKY